MEPEQSSSKLPKFVKSYVISGIIGILGFYISLHVGIYYTLAIIETLVALLLVLFKAEHPPAMGIAVVFILEKANIFGLIFLLTGVIVIILMDKFLNKFVYILKNDVKVKMKKL